MELLCLGEGERSRLRGEGAEDGADFMWEKMEENLLRRKQDGGVGLYFWLRRRGDYGWGYIMVGYCVW